MKLPGTVVVFFLVKAVITVSLIAWICSKIDFALLARHLTGGGAVYFALGALLLAFNDTVVAMRWWLLLRRLGVDTMPLGYAIAATYAAVFLGQVTPGAIGSDAVRGWLGFRRGANLRVAVMSLVTDRALAMLGLIVVAGSAWFWQFDAVDPNLGRMIVVLGATVVASAAIGLWLIPAVTGSFARRWPRLRMVHESVVLFRYAALSGAGAAGLVLSCCVLALTVNAVLLFARGFDVVLVPTVAYMVVPLAILSAALPISIAGWGVREASLSYGLILLGTPPQDAAPLGVTLGIGLLLASLPGGIAVLAMGEKVRPPLRFPDGGLAK
jgi:hypothetical protein